MMAALKKAGSSTLRLLEAVRRRVDRGIGDGYCFSDSAKSWLRLTTKRAPFAGTAVE